MDDRTFFSYYIPALEKAFSEDHINYGFFVKGQDSFYPEEVMHELEEFVDSHYDEYPVLEHAAYYFDALSHYESNVRGIEINQYKKQIQDDIEKIRKKFDL